VDESADVEAASCLDLLFVPCVACDGLDDGVFDGGSDGCEGYADEAIEFVCDGVAFAGMTGAV
jgi:hypothetical protein